MILNQCALCQQHGLVPGISRSSFRCSVRLDHGGTTTAFPGDRPCHGVPHRGAGRPTTFATRRRVTGRRLRATSEPRDRATKCGDRSGTVTASGGSGPAVRTTGHIDAAVPRAPRPDAQFMTACRPRRARLDMAPGSDVPRGQERGDGSRMAAALPSGLGAWPSDGWRREPFHSGSPAVGAGANRVPNESMRSPDGGSAARRDRDTDS